MRVHLIAPSFCHWKFTDNSLKRLKKDCTNFTFKSKTVLNLNYPIILYNGTIFPVPAHYREIDRICKNHGVRHLQMSNYGLISNLNWLVTNWRSPIHKIPDSDYVLLWSPDTEIGPKDKWIWAMDDFIKCNKNVGLIAANGPITDHKQHNSFSFNPLSSKSYKICSGNFNSSIVLIRADVCRQLDATYHHGGASQDLFAALNKVPADGFILPVITTSKISIDDEEYKSYKKEANMKAGAPLYSDWIKKKILS